MCALNSSRVMQGGLGLVDLGWILPASPCFRLEAWCIFGGPTLRRKPQALLRTLSIKTDRRAKNEVLQSSTLGDFWGALIHGHGNGYMV